MAASRLFPLKVPRTLLDRIERGNINDPILQQILPIAAELNVASGFSTDPVSEQHNQPAGIIHKYHGRVLLMVNGHCAINCRYCFRRHYPYNDNRLNRTQWEKAIDVIRQDTSIREIIYSGGDPLASSDKQLHWLTQKIAEIPHITRLRIHTRLPIVIPQRITPDTLAWMTQTRLSTIMVLHCNHANELKDDTLISAIQTMKSAGITLLNQAVLLKNVNDNLGSLIDLSERLFHTGVLPYYLHLLDKVQGAAHFDIDETRAKNLHTELTHHHSGYLVPKLVREVANHPSKISL
jgi:EF-P beta-lysylation protein EpmB